MRHRYSACYGRSVHAVRLDAYISGGMRTGRVPRSKFLVVVLPPRACALRIMHRSVRYTDDEYRNDKRSDFSHGDPGFGDGLRPWVRDDARGKIIHHGDVRVRPPSVPPFPHTACACDRDDVPAPSPWIPVRFRPLPRKPPCRYV
jgi:hypothetical protein